MNTNGLSVNGAAVFGDRLATGLSIDITDSRKLSFAQVGLVEPNVFEYSQVSFYNEVFFHPYSRIDISLPIKLGIGHATVNPKELHTGRAELQGQARERCAVPRRIWQPFRRNWRGFWRARGHRMGRLRRARNLHHRQGRNHPLQIRRPAG